MSAQPISLTRLNNGITVITVENQAADLIAARCFFRAGGRWEKPDQSGISHLLATVITKGTQTLTSAEIADRVESVGANLGTDAAADYFTLGLKTVTADFPEILNLAADILRSPSCPEAEVQLERQLTIQNIRAQSERPFSVAFQQLREAMYGEHPYGCSILGTPETLNEITAADLKDYHQTYFRPDNLVISLSGRMEPERAIAQIAAAFEDWAIPDPPLPVAPLLPTLPPPSSHTIHQDTQQAIIMVGYPAPAVHNLPDYIALKVINTYLGSGLSSRLFVELREKRGLAYDVSAFYPTRFSESQFVAYIGTAPENAQVGFDGLVAEIERLCQVPLTEAELQAAKNKLLGQYALGKQTNADLAQLFGWYTIIDLGIEFDQQFQAAVNLITPDQIQAAAQRYFQTPYIARVGPEPARETLAR